MILSEQHSLLCLRSGPSSLLLGFNTAYVMPPATIPTASAAATAIPTKANIGN